MYKKMAKLNPVIEHEEIVDRVEIIDTNIVVRDNAPPRVSEETHPPGNL